MATDIILILMGITVFLLTLRSANKNLIKPADKTEGVIVDFNDPPRKNDTSKYPVVRFTTKENELFTLPVQDSYLPGRVKKGKKVTVLYNPDNPQEFAIQLPNEKLMFATVLTGSAIFILSGILLLLNQLNIIHILIKKNTS